MLHYRALCDVFDTKLVVGIVQANEVSLNDFVDLMTSDSGPECLLWLPIFQRLAAVENGNH